MKILIVEDNFVSRRLLSVTLTKLGHTIITAEDGKTAYYQFTEHHPDIIISDWMMPEMDGLELCRTIRLQKHEQYPYFILLTALTSKKHFLEGMEAGADDFLKKPFDAEELHARLRVAERMLSLQREVITLTGLIPICSCCKNIRDDQGYWKRIEQYFKEHSGASFTHGICPDCVTKFFPGVPTGEITNQ